MQVVKAQHLLAKLQSHCRPCRLQAPCTFTWKCMTAPTPPCSGSRAAWQQSRHQPRATERDQQQLEPVSKRDEQDASDPAANSGGGLNRLLLFGGLVTAAVVAGGVGGLRDKVQVSAHEQPWARQHPCNRLRLPFSALWHVISPFHEDSVVKTCPCVIGGSEGICLSCTKCASPS